MATNYQRGAARERMIGEYHRKLGFGVVRSAGSKGRFDLIAWKPFSFWKAIQAKSTQAEANAAMRDLATTVDLPRGTVLEVWLKLRFGWRVWRLAANGTWTVVSDGPRPDQRLFFAPREA